MSGNARLLVGVVAHEETGTRLHRYRPTGYRPRRRDKRDEEDRDDGGVRELSYLSGSDSC